MSFAGCAKTGTSFNTWVCGFYEDRCSAFREMVDNACSAKATICDIRLVLGKDVGMYHPGNLPVLSIFTDTSIPDLDHALDIAHGTQRTYGPFNNFGVGCKGFRAKLGPHVQMLVMTYQRADDGVETVSMGRMGSVMDHMTEGKGDHIGKDVFHGTYDASGMLRLDWRGDMNKREIFLSNLPWYREHGQTHDERVKKMATVLDEVRHNVNNATFFLFYDDQTNMLPIRNDEGKLSVVEESGVQQSIVEALQKKYIDIGAQRMPHITVGCQVARFDRHPWKIALGATPHIDVPSHDVFLPGIPDKVATVRYLRTDEDPFAAYSNKRDGAYLVVGERKVIAGPGALYSGTEFHAHVRDFGDFWAHARSKGTGTHPEHRKTLRDYICCGVPSVEAMFDKLVPQSTFSKWVPKTQLWGRIGLGVLAFIEFNLEVMHLDMSKTRFVFDNHVNATSCLAHLRFHLLAWSIADYEHATFEPPFAKCETHAMQTRQHNYPIIQYVPRDAPAPKRRRVCPSYKSMLRDAQGAHTELKSGILGVLGDTRLADGDKLRAITALVQM